jgi:anti-sigma factor ChrR (cupin superfamily)
MASSVVIRDLIAGGWRDMEFRPFREGVEIVPILDGKPAVALLRYEAGAEIPLHSHPALETILVLEGSQRDEHGVYEAGTLLLNPEGTRHAVASDEGCVVLIQWNEPVKLLA